MSLVFFVAAPGRALPFPGHTFSRYVWFVTWFNLISLTTTALNARDVKPYPLAQQRQKVGGAAWRPRDHFASLCEQSVCVCVFAPPFPGWRFGHLGCSLELCLEARPRENIQLKETCGGFYFVHLVNWPVVVVFCVCGKSKSFNYTRWYMVYSAFLIFPEIIK